jgi:hypothetical protein
MGKNARNENIKLAAMYYNNLSVAFLVAGFAIPWLNLYPKLNWSPLAGAGDFFINTAPPFIIAYLLATALRIAAVKTIAKIED